MGGYTSLKSSAFGFTSENSISTVKICPILSSKVSDYNSCSTSSIFGAFFSSFIHPKGNDLVMANPY